MRRSTTAAIVGCYVMEVEGLTGQKLWFLNTPATSENTADRLPLFWPMLPNQCSADAGTDTLKKQTLYRMPVWLTLA